MPALPRRFWMYCSALWMFSLTLAVSADESLHMAVDRMLEPTGPTSALCSDAEFLRRVYLDLIGMPPTSDETRLFLADASANKRELVVDRLLARPEHARHLTHILDVTLMERRSNQNVSAEDWHKYLHASVAANRPYHVLAREILAADGAQPNLRPAVRFYLDRNAEPNLITRDIGRIFFGRDLQCAQCHDSPLIADYHQFDYHGLFAYVGAGYLLTRKEGDKQVNYYAEKAGTDGQFESVFVKGTKHLTGPRLLDDLELAETVFVPGDEYHVKPADGVLAQPKFSRRAKLAELATNGSNRAFNENIANRLWAILFGRGLVHPLDLHHSANPPSHPELLRFLGERFAAMNFDMRSFLRELALTQAYQRSVEVPGNIAAASPLARERLAPLEARNGTLAPAAEAAGSAFHAAIDEWNKAEAALLPAIAEVDKARAQHADAANKLVPVEKAFNDASTNLKTKRDQVTAVQTAADAANAVVQKLPMDTELKAAAAKLSERTQQLTAEVPPLEKAAQDAQAAMKPHQDAIQAAQQAFSSAAANAAPHRELARQKEQVVLSTRREMILQRSSLDRVHRRLETLKLLAAVEPLTTEFTAASQIVQAKSAEMPAAKQKLSESVALVTTSQAEHKTAAEAKAASEKVLTELKTRLVQSQSTHTAVATAAAQAEAALAKLGNDPVVADALTKLKTRATQLQTDVTTLKPQLDTATSTFTDASAKEQAALTVLTAAQESKTAHEKTVNEIQTVLSAAEQTAHQKRLALADSTSALTVHGSSDFSVAALKPLSPEQMCWSILKITGIYDRTAAAEEAELNKSTPLSEEAKKDPVQVAARTRDIEQRTYDKLKGNVAAFIAVYAAGAGQPQGDFFATADQALFAANGGIINSWSAPAGGNVAERVINQADPAKAAEDLYVTVLGRLPSLAQVEDVTAYLASRPQDRPAAVQELVWGLITSAEFRFSH